MQNYFFFLLKRPFLLLQEGSSHFSASELHDVTTNLGEKLTDGTELNSQQVNNNLVKVFVRFANTRRHLGVCSQAFYLRKKSTMLFAHKECLPI